MGGTLLQTILIETKEVLPSYYWKTKKKQAIMSSLRMNYVMI